MNIAEWKQEARKDEAVVRGHWVAGGGGTEVRISQLAGVHSWARRDFAHRIAESLSWFPRESLLSLKEPKKWTGVACIFKIWKPRDSTHTVMVSFTSL